MILAIPEEKRLCAVELQTEFMAKKKATIKDLQKLCGFLNFLGKAIYPGRTFTTRMYAKYSKVLNIDGKPADQFFYTNGNSTIMSDWMKSSRRIAVSGYNF